MRNLVEFDALPWASSVKGMREKAVELPDGRKMRLVEFSTEFVEEDWCRVGHAGYVLEGCVDIKFGESGKTLRFSAGDGLITLEGEPDRHKASVPQGKTALLLLIDGG